MSQLRRLVPMLLACVLIGAAADAAGQTRGATRTKYIPPVYPEEAAKKDEQGNVLLIGKIGVDGKVSDLRFIAATQKDFVKPAIEAVKAWEFAPAMRDGKPIVIPLNAGARFRISGGSRGLIRLPILGDLAVFPADAAGAKTAPDGFPIRKGKDAALRAEVDLDIPPLDQPRTLTMKVDAVSPTGRKIPLFQPPVAAPALATNVKFPVVAPIGATWEDGVWYLRFNVDGHDAGGGQFWLATNPDTFRFELPAR